MLNEGRYKRQAALGVIGPVGQRKLAGSTVLVVGCGALGSMQAEFLARAGVGRLILADRDILELHNLQSQLLYDEKDVAGRLPKAEAAARRLRAVNSSIKIEAVITDVNAANIEELAGPADIILDASDNFGTRYLLNDAAVRAGKPWVYGGVLGKDGMVLAVRPGQGPCLRCVFEEPPEGRRLQTCDTQGVLNTAVAWTAALQVTEALKFLTGAAAESRLHTLDVWSCSAGSIAAQRRAGCVCCGLRRFEFLDAAPGAAPTLLCGRHAVQLVARAKPGPDFARLSEKLAPLGAVTANGLLLEFTCGAHRLVVFADGRVLVMGTADTDEAKRLAEKYIWNL
ncbi:MAG TPA: ThiF family adenylyltransferase [Elusimicrobiales bacterium]|nr:ThiF family adenylyltransferase [Elusimicrobiales bacterium]